MHSCVLFARWTEALVTRAAVVTLCSAPSLDQASTNSTPAFDLLSFLGLPDVIIVEIANNPVY